MFRQSLNDEYQKVLGSVSCHFCMSIIRKARRCYFRVYDRTPTAHDPFQSPKPAKGKTNGVLNAALFTVHGIVFVSITQVPSFQKHLALNVSDASKYLGYTLYRSWILHLHLASVSKTPSLIVQSFSIENTILKYLAQPWLQANISAAHIPAEILHCATIERILTTWHNPHNRTQQTHLSTCSSSRSKPNLLLISSRKHFSYSTEYVSSKGRVFESGTAPCIASANFCKFQRQISGCFIYVYLPPSSDVLQIWSGSNLSMKPNGP